MAKINRVGGMTIHNIIGFIWAVFSGIVVLRVANPLYDAIFGGLDWTGKGLIKFGLLFIFAIFIFAVVFFIPFKVYTEIREGLMGEKVQENFEDDGS